MIEEARPELVVGYGSYLELLFRTVAREGGLAHRPRAIRYGADAMSTEGRREIESELGIPVLSNYGAAEALRIGFFCERRDGFHLHDDLVHVRVVDDTGAQVPDGEVGELVVSNLVNRGTVLLGYRIGDTGSLDRTPCACGRATPRLARLNGRISEVIPLPGGDVVFTDAIWGCVKPRPEVIRFQLVEVAPLRFELRLRLAAGAQEDDVAADVAGRVRRLLRGAEVTPVSAPALGDGGGKIRPVALLPRP
jgi:phenylacetate-CoA ligase